MNSESKLKHFPISFFTTVMGLSGLTIAWEKAEHIFAFSFSISGYLLILTSIVFIFLVFFYAAKIVRFPGDVAAELHHPVKISFFPATSISLILLGVCTLHISPLLSKTLWGAGALLQFLFTFYVLGAWITKQHFKIEHVNPAWFIPVVGNILVPIAGVPHGYIELSWFFFSIGLILWVILLVIVFNRIIFYHPMPDKLLPTLFILIPPPALGFLSYLNLVGHTDGFARILYYTGLFFTLMLASQVQRFAKLNFSLSWWAYSFPMAAITIATLVMYSVLGGPWFQGLAIILLTVLSLILFMLVSRTLLSIRRREICVKEE